MISKVGIENSNEKLVRPRLNKEGVKCVPSFKGLGSAVIAGMQACERMPMINVTVVDMLSATLPRTIVESMTNWFAGFEAFRRESSGLVVNCLIPSLVTLGLAKCINPAFMPKGVNMSRCWADSSLVDRASGYYKEISADSTDGAKVKEALKNLLGDIEGYEGKKHVIFKDALGEKELNSYAEKLAEISRTSRNDKTMRREVKKIAAEITAKTHIGENIKTGGQSEVKALSVDTLLEDSVKFFKEFQKTDGKIGIEKFASKSKQLIKTKSLAGLAVIIPLACSMQYINRIITGKLSGVKGAPIYDDFAKSKENIEETPKAKEGIWVQKIMSIGLMLSVSLLSMMKKPSMNMLEFKGMFPTMDQARIISTATFASRMAAADDKNELAEARVRDIVTFASLYFLGDYVAKAFATMFQKTAGVTLLNETKQIDKNAGKWEKFKHWIKYTNLKSSEEVVSKTEQSLMGLTPSKEQAGLIEKELKKAKKLRSACQAANIGVSLAILGLIVPIFARQNTKKKHEKSLRLALEQSQAEAESNRDTAWVQESSHNIPSQ